MGSWSGEDSSKGSGWRTWAGKVVAGGAGGRNNWGVRQTAQPRVPVRGNKASKPLTEKNLWGLHWQEELPASQESSLERPTGS